MRRLAGSDRDWLGIAQTPLYASQARGKGFEASLPLAGRITVRHRRAECSGPGCPVYGG